MSTKPEIEIAVYGNGRYFDADGKSMDEAVCAEIDARFAKANAVIAAHFAAPPRKERVEVEHE